MKNFNKLFTNFSLLFLTALVLFGGGWIAPAVAAIGAGAAQFVKMPSALFSGFITQGSEFNGKENEDILLRPLFTGTRPDQLGIRVIFTVKSSLKVTFFGTLKKILKVYADGFQGGSSAPQTQKKFELEEFKAESEYSKQDYKDTILENITHEGGIKQNDITGTNVFEAEVRVFQAGVDADIFRIFWLGNKTKKTVTSGVSDDGTPDVDYNVIDGVWEAIFVGSETLPNGDASGLPAEDQIKRVVIANGTTAQISTATLTGASGTANVLINSVNYLATFATSLTVTAADFVTTHATALLLVGIKATSAGAVITLTADIDGRPFVLSSVLNVTSDLAGSVADTTPNVGASDLIADEARDTFKTMLTTKARQVMKQIPKGMTRIYVTDTMLENYQETLEADGTEQAHQKQIDGLDRLVYRGVPLLPTGIDEDLTADDIDPFPHRAIWTTPQNLVLIMNGTGDFAETKFWFNPDENKNRQRTQFEYGADFLLPEWMTVAY